MNPKSLKTKILLTCIFTLAAFTFADAQRSTRKINEAFVQRAMRTLHSAQATYQATGGNGNFGSLRNLRQMGLIDEALATGNKYGYVFVVTFVPYSPPSTPAAFTITATPRLYRKTGYRSFFIATEGIVRGADKQGLPADENDPDIDEESRCPTGGEQCTIPNLRTLHGAEATYQATSGIGNFGSLDQLRAAGLIPRTLASGAANGYNYTVTFVIQTQTVPASFRISAVPQVYGTTGIRSYLITTDGVIRCADRNGTPADENDPPCDQ
jgi:hypothetical protein